MIKPLRNFVLVTKSVGEKKSTGGIHLVSLGEPSLVTEKVVAVGSGYVSNGVVVPLEVKEGDKVSFNSSSATEIKDGDDTFWLVGEENVLAVVS